MKRHCDKNSKRLAMFTKERSKPHIISKQLPYLLNNLTNLSTPTKRQNFRQQCIVNLNCTLSKLRFIFFAASSFLLLLLLGLSYLIQNQFSDRNYFQKQTSVINNRNKIQYFSSDNFRQHGNVTKPSEVKIVPVVLCVWFTTFKDDVRRRTIHLNTLHNWAKFIPLMQPVLFSSNFTRQFDSIARQLGWHVYQIPRVNDHGTPYISDMLNVIMNNDTYNSVFYGFANGDILFDTSLSETLKALASGLNSLLQPPVLVTGQRTNYKMSDNWTQPIVDFYYIEQLRARGKLFGGGAQDYFLFTRDFPRYLFKKLVIGRPAYDNYLIAMSLKLKVSVVDATKTLTALHQQLPNESEHAGYENKDSGHNLKIIGKFYFNAGNTNNAQYETVFDLDMIHIGVRKR